MGGFENFELRDVNSSHNELTRQSKVPEKYIFRKWCVQDWNLRPQGYELQSCRLQILKEKSA